MYMFVVIREKMEPMFDRIPEAGPVEGNNILTLP